MSTPSGFLTEFYTAQHPLGWLIYTSMDGLEHALSRSGPAEMLIDPLAFGREQDAKAAIRGMAEQGIISATDVLKRDRFEVVKICIESLGW